MPCRVCEFVVEAGRGFPTDLGCQTKLAWSTASAAEEAAESGQRVEVGEIVILRYIVAAAPDCSTFTPEPQLARSFDGARLIDGKIGSISAEKCDVCRKQTANG